MAFIVENGSGRSDANSFVDVAYFRDYHSDRGNDDVTAWTDREIEIAAIKATSYILLKYGSRFQGRPVNSDQTLPFPRTGVYVRSDTGRDAVASNIVPDRIRQAVCELGLVSKEEDLLPDIMPGDGTLSEQKIGPITMKYDSSEGLPYPVWRKADMLVSPYLTRGGMNVRIVRS